MPNGSILWSQRTWLIVVVDEVRHGGKFATVSRTMYPVVDNVIDIVEYASPTDTGVTACIVSPQVAHKSGVLASDGRAKGMVPSVESFGTNSILDGDVDCRFLTIRFPIVHVEHVAIERDVFV